MGGINGLSCPKGILNIECERPDAEYWVRKGIKLAWPKDNCGFNRATKSWAMEPALRAAFDYGRTVVIGNGGFGASGGIEFLAKKYNAYLAEKLSRCGSRQAHCEKYLPVNVIWYAGDSNENMKASEKLDLAITYEPVLEDRLKRNGLVREVLPLFVNFFGLIVPKEDPLGVKQFFFIDRAPHDPGPVVVMMYIMLQGLWAIKFGLGQIGKTYASRWNFSAMACVTTCS